VRLKSG